MRYIHVCLCVGGGGSVSVCMCGCVCMYACHATAGRREVGKKSGI